MRTLLLVLVAVLAALPASGCKPNAKSTNVAVLLSEVKTGLERRDRKLSSYSLEGHVKEGAHEARYTFRFRSPGKMQGTLTAPAQRTFAFDGQTLFEVDPAQKKFTRFALEGSTEEASLLLNQVFSAFVSEGYRVPLIVRDGVAVERITHARASDAVKITQTAKDGAGEVSIGYVLRWPSLDFIEKTLASNGSVMKLLVEEEHCDEALKLCVPKRLSQWEGEKQLGTTELTKIALNPAIPADDFTLTVPQGFSEETRTLQ